jgi:GNAT superfamily N-acetyltransferase
MQFLLSDELIHDIIFAMENQSADFLFDSQELKCCSLEELNKSEQSIDKNRYYEIPQWNSAMGFRVMEQFVSSLHNPIAREELKNVLFSGKSVFKNFKKVLHSYPELEKKWFSFKELQMKNLISQWYDMLRESWGLEKLSEEIEDYPELIHDGFVFKEGNATDFIELYNEVKNKFIAEVDNSDINGFEKAFSHLIKINFSSLDENETFLHFAETEAGDFAGAIAVSSCPSGTKDVVQIPFLFVEDKFRGFGLARELMDRSLTFLRRNSVRRVLIASTILPQHFISVLEQNGFYQSGTCFVADLFNFI